MNNTKRTLLLSLGVAALFLTATPAMAAMVNPYGFSVDNATAVFTLGNPDSMLMTLQSGSSASLVHLGNTALFNTPTGPWGFTLNMSITPLTGVSGVVDIASGAGTLTLTDNDGDYISASFSGGWTRWSPETTASFGGTLSSVVFHDVSPLDGKFNGKTGDAVVMSMLGTIGDISANINPSANWWFNSDLAMSPVQVKGDVVAVPVPAAVLLGFLGLSAAGLGLRKLA
jgi:hypothetical protein